ncbi:hypothetical protein RFI_22944 [Reticulomyxa filosa]|uniref:UBP34/UBP24/USP9X/USP9Y-like ARM repeat region domain-containing protein n=1 Tax=Reticulomyxa filosa TaxID=46433 RepID=X6MLX4_RETFI|nr:hypothetical protein RFI_22944 [Reticulomyxa filosa]|eukprot:ETO14422.1 hypothetical protein RFI_22944 [Reticulomyxa filosa]
MEVKETVILHALFRQIRCPFAQKRIAGMTEMMQHIDLVIDKNEYEKSEKAEKSPKALRPEKEEAFKNIWAEPEWMQEWIKKNGVLDYILDRTTTHLELVRRILPMYRLFHHNQQIDNKEHLDPLWKLTTGGTHEVIESMKLINMHYFIDSQLLELIKIYTLTAYQVQQKDRSNAEKKSTCLAWKCFGSLCKPPMSLQIKTVWLIDMFLELLETEYATSQKSRYIEKCIWHIQESSNVVQNMILLQKLVQTYPRTKKKWLGINTTQHQETQAGMIEKLEKDFAIVEHILQDLTFYKGKVTSKLQTLHQETKNIEVQTLRVDESSYGYLDQLKTRLDFLLYLLTHSSLRLTREQYKIIWDHFVTGALCREEMDLCYIWLLRGSIPPHVTSLTNAEQLKLYETQDQKYLFDNCICRLPAAHLSEALNKRNGSLLIKGTKKKLPTSEERDLIRQATNGKTASTSPRLDLSKKVPPMSPTEAAREVLGQYITSLDNDMLNEDGSSYLIDPDDHYVDPKLLHIVDYQQLEGRNYFWLAYIHTYTYAYQVTTVKTKHAIERDVVLRARLPIVGNQASELLNALHFNFTVRLKSKEQFEIRQAHVQRCLGFLTQGLATEKQSEDRRIVVKRMIRLLKSFLECFVQKEDTKQTVELEIRPHKFFRLANYKLVVRINDSFGNLRKTIFNRLHNIHNGLVESEMIIRWNKFIIGSNNDNVRLVNFEWNKSNVLDVSRTEYSLVRDFERWYGEFIIYIICIYMYTYMYMHLT